MDESVMKFVQILGEQKTEYVENSVLKELSNQLSFELIAKNIIGILSALDYTRLELSWNKVTWNVICWEIRKRMKATRRHI